MFFGFVTIDWSATDICKSLLQLQSSLSTIQSVVLTSDVFHFFMKSEISMPFAVRLLFRHRVWCSFSELNIAPYDLRDGL